MTLLAALAITLGILSVITGLAGVGLSLLIIADYSSLAATILVSLGTVVFLFGIIEIFYGVGFLEHRGWSWTLGMIIALVNLFSSIVVIALPDIVGPRLTAAAGPADVIALGVLIIIAEIAIIPIITSLLTIYGLTRQNVKAFFGKGPRPQA